MDKIQTKNLGIDIQSRLIQVSIFQTRTYCVEWIWRHYRTTLSN